MNLAATTSRCVESARPYFSGRDWVAGIWQRWRQIAGIVIVTYVTSNGCASAVSALPWPSIAKHAPEVAISWSGAIISTVVLAVFHGAQHISQSRSRSPFSP